MFISHHHSISYHHSLEIYLSLQITELIGINESSCKVGNIHATI